MQAVHRSAEQGGLLPGRHHVTPVLDEPLEARRVGAFRHDHRLDRPLARCPVDEVAGRIARVIRQLRPQVVIGHDPRGVNGHPDHIASHWALRHALLAEPVERFAMICYPPEVAEQV